MWYTIWKWATDNYILHTLVAIGVLALIFSLLGSKKVKKIKVSPTGVEVETADQDIDPGTPCPYTKSRDVTFNAIRDVEGKVNDLTKEMQEIVSIVKNMSIDQQKQLFYDVNQPDAERLAGGLKYLFQGGNGHTKKDVVAFAEQHKDIYNALTHVKPELRLIYDTGGNT